MTQTNEILRFFVVDIEAECQDDYMKIRVGFNGSFTGLLYSAGNFHWQCINYRIGLAFLIVCDLN